MTIFFFGVLLLFLSGIFSTFFAKDLKIVFTSILSTFGAILCSVPAIKVLINNEAISSTLNFSHIFGEINFTIDALSAFFVIVISIMSLMSIFYSKGYLKNYIEQGKNINSHLIFLSTLISSMLLVVTCHNALMFLICWELMSLSSFFLVIFESEKKEILKAGIKYLIFMHVSVLFIILAFVIASINAGSLNFTDFVKVFQENVHIANLVFLLAFVGFGTKSGFVPFHNWLPDAHPAAPSHVSAVMSGVMIKTGIYGILRILTLLAIPSKLISYTVLAISLITALYGVLYSITQQDVKRFLAYCSIENIGIIGIGVGTGMLGLSYGNNMVAVLGFAGAILHILNHSIFKEILFFAAGSVYSKTHTRDIEILGGLVKPMPLTAIFFLVSSIAVCALPPFNGFISEFLIYFGMLNGLKINNFFTVVMFLFAIAGLAFVGTMAMISFTKAFSIIFLGSPRSQVAESVENDAPKSMIIPMGILSLMMLLIGIFPQFVLNAITNCISLFVADVQNILTMPTQLLQQISIFVLGFIGFVILLIILKNKLCGKTVMYETWGCGYDRLNNHIQYTGSSYASPFLSMLKPLFKKVFDIEKPKRLFPKSAHFNLHIDDIEEAYVIDPFVKFDEWFFSKFEKMQSGNIQSYIKYGLLFLALIIIGCLISK